MPVRLARPVQPHRSALRRRRVGEPARLGLKGEKRQPALLPQPVQGLDRGPGTDLSGLELPNHAAASVEPVEPGLGWADQIVLGLAGRRARIRQARDRVDAAGQHLQRIWLPGGGGHPDPHRLMAMDREGKLAFNLDQRETAKTRRQGKHGPIVGKA